MPSTSLFNPLASTFTLVTGGQTQIPAGSALFSITAVSGGFWVNGTGPFVSPTVFRSEFGNNQALNVGCTGGNTAIFYQR